MQKHEVRPGIKVTIAHPNYVGTVWEVERPKDVKAILRGADDRTKAMHPRGLDAPMAMLRPYDPDAPVEAPRPFEYKAPEFTAGTVVRLKQPYAEWDTTSLMVVISVNDRTYSICRLGGADGTRYMRVGLGGVIKVELADVLR